MSHILKYEIRRSDGRCLTNCPHIRGDIHVGSFGCKYECNHLVNFDSKSVECDYKNPDSRELS